MRESVRIAATGDVGIIGETARFVWKYGDEWLLEKTRELFSSVDVTIFNLEMPFAPVDSIRTFDSLNEFRVDPAHIGSLSFPGARIACLANNHIMDFGEHGLRCTLDTLTGAGIHCVGAGSTPEDARRPVVVQVSGLRVGVLAYAMEGRHSVGSRPGAATAELDDMLSDVRALRPSVEILVVALHSGLVYVDLPSPADRKVKLALVDAGADLVLGHHPHVLQGVEAAGHGLIAHSLGEFIFDGAVGNVTAEHARDRRRQSAILIAQFSKDGLREWMFEPVWIADGGRPEPAGCREGAVRKRIADVQVLLESGDYEAHFKKNASENLVSHEVRVLISALARADFFYLLDKLLRVRSRHLGLLFTYLKRRVRSTRSRDSDA